MNKKQLRKAILLEILVKGGWQGQEIPWRIIQPLIAERCIDWEEPEDWDSFILKLLPKGEKELFE